MTPDEIRQKFEAYIQRDRPNWALDRMTDGTYLNPMVQDRFAAYVEGFYDGVQVVVKVIVK